MNEELKYYVNLEGLQEKKISTCKCLDTKYVVRHDNVPIYGKGTVQVILERYKK